jgi:hypothetical protein
MITASHRVPMFAPFFLDATTREPVPTLYLAGSKGKTGSTPILQVLVIEPASP